MATPLQYIPNKFDIQIHCEEFYGDQDTSVEAYEFSLTSEEEAELLATAEAIWKVKSTVETDTSDSAQASDTLVSAQARPS